MTGPKLSWKWRAWHFMQGLLFSESAAWASQNAVGAVFPLLFMVVDKMNFSGACVGILFYGVSTQAFSIDRSCGGRNFGAILWSGGLLCGGIIAFALTSLAWTARGDAEGILEYKPPLQETQLTPEETAMVKEYLLDTAYTSIPDDGKDVLVPKLEESLKIFESKTVSSSFLALQLVLYCFASLFLARCRTCESEFINTARGTVSHVYLTVISTLALVLPLLGPDLYWDHAIGGMIKAVLVTMFGAMVGPMLVYVQSSHDNLRRQLADLMIKTGSYLSLTASIISNSMHQGEQLEISAGVSIDEVKGQLKKSKESLYSGLNQLIGNSTLIETSVANCALEPPWPLITSQWGSDHRKYARVLSQFQIMLGSIHAIASLATLSLQQLTEKSPVDEEINTLNVVEEIAALVATALQDLAICLQHMPLFGPCSGNQVVWRPKSPGYWKDSLENLGSTIYGSLDFLKACADEGIVESLGSVNLEKLADCKVTGITPLLLAACESLVDECQLVEVYAAQALEIKDIEDTKDGAHGSPQKEDTFCNNSSWSQRVYSSLVGKPLGWLQQMTDRSIILPVKNLLLAASSFNTWVLTISRFFLTWKQLLSGNWMRRDNFRALLRDWNFQFYLKYYFSVSLAYIAVMLIGWYRYGNTDNASKNATSMANWYGDWQPEYFVIASIICMQQQLEASIVKAFLRTAIIAFGGALGYVTMLNGTLAQNAYFVFFMGTLVNGFFGLFSPLGIDFRYTLFLAVYTWNGVVYCQYTGVCCKPGTVLTFGGKALSTALGALYAFFVTALIVPLYSSEVILSMEGKFLKGSMQILDNIFHDCLSILKEKSHDKYEKKDLEEGGEDKPQKYLSLQTEVDPRILAKFRQYSESITKLRLATFKGIVQQKKINSLDHRIVLFLEVTLIPLPKSIDLILHRLSRFGAFTSASAKSLKNNLITLQGGAPTEFFLREIMYDTEDILVQGKKLSTSICTTFERCSNKKLMQSREQVGLALKDMSASRKALREKYLSIKSRLMAINTWKYGDLRLLIFYQFVLEATVQLEALALDIVTDDRTMERDGYFSWIFSWWTRMDTSKYKHQ